MHRPPKSVIVAPHEDGMRLSSYIRARILPTLSGKAIQTALHMGVCRVNGRLERFASYRINDGDRIQIDMERLAALSELSRSKLQILYDDADIQIVNKPPGIECAPKNFPGVELAHRLDKDTSGVLVLTKTEEAKKHMHALFAGRMVSKIYLAIVHGVPEETEWECKDRLGVIQEIDQQKIYGKTDDGKTAVTHFRLIKPFENYSLMECFPKTGRTHQIRVHAKASGIPIVGDLLYAKEKKLPSHVVRHLLHAHSIEFIHPLSGEKLHIVAPAPEDFEAFLDDLA